MTKSLLPRLSSFLLLLASAYAAPPLPTTPVPALTAARAAVLLRIAQALVWTYPSSSGNPLAGDHYRSLVARRASFADAARLFLQRGDTEAAAEIAAGAWRLWVKARDVRGGRAFLADVLAAPRSRPTSAYALALCGDGLLAFLQGRIDMSLSRSTAALTAALQLHDPLALALACTGVSRAALENNPALARDMACRARRYARALPPAFDQAPLHLLAQSHFRLGNLRVASTLFRRSLETNRRLADNGMVAVELHNLGWVEVHRGNAAEARRNFEACARLSDPKDPYFSALGQLNSAAVAWCCGDWARAHQLLKSVDVTLKTHRITLDSDELREHTWLSSRLHSRALPRRG